MLALLRPCPATGDTVLSIGFRKDLHQFADYLPSTNRVYMILANSREPIHLYVDACSMGAGDICGSQAYYVEFPAEIIDANHPICHLEAETQ